MPRYIDAEALIEQVDKKQRNLETNNDTMWEVNRKYWKGLAMARSLVDEQPTANVMSREEAGFYIKQARQEVAKEIFEEIENALESCYNPDICADYPIPYYDLWLADRIAELKNKYTEESSNE